VQPLATVAPQFAQSADQLQRLAIALGGTRDALSNNVDDIGRVGTDLAQLQRQLDTVATTLDRPGLFGPGTLLPFQLAYYGMCLLVIAQSVFSLIAGIFLFQLQRPTESPLALRTATTNGDVRDPVREW
jgi:hypothetical protein